MAEYRENQLQRVSDDTSEFYRLKVTSDGNETHWMNVSPGELQDIIRYFHHRDK
jgi:hypothetical protein